MTSLLEWFYEQYNKNDPRTGEWFLVSRPWTLIAIVLFYIYFCVSAGPKYMRNKEAYSLRTTLIVYNFLQVLVSTYMFYEGLMAGWLFEYSLGCQPVDYSYSPSAIRMASAIHLYFVCKIVELLDTVFFVLRKKQSQVTFLHLYHHVTMPLVVWYGVRYFPGGQATLLGLVNCFVHIIMYTYYLLAALGPQIQKYLWWKKYLTLLQIVQFFGVGLHSAHKLFIDCDFPKILSLLLVIESMIFAYMFISFYVEHHVRSKDNVHVNGTDSRTTLKAD